MAPLLSFGWKPSIGQHGAAHPFEGSRLFLKGFQGLLGLGRGPLSLAGTLRRAMESSKTHAGSTGRSFASRRAFGSGARVAD